MASDRPPYVKRTDQLRARAINRAERLERAARDTVTRLSAGGGDVPSDRHAVAAIELDAALVALDELAHVREEEDTLRRAGVPEHEITGPRQLTLL